MERDKLNLAIDIKYNAAELVILLDIKAAKKNVDKQAAKLQRLLQEFVKL